MEQNGISFHPSNDGKEQQSIVEDTKDSVHLRWMQEAMQMVRRPCLLSQRFDTDGKKAEEAFAAGEVPVGCVFVRGDTAIAKARNRTNELRNVSISFP